jgi:N-methylhydantoinase B
MPGGDGLVREIELLADAEVTVLSERRRRGPYGLDGGEPGAPGRNLVIRDGKAEAHGGKLSVMLKAGDRLRVETPGGGAHGRKE